MTRQTGWLVLFLTATGLAVGGELWAAFDNSSNTVPWTELLTDLPWWVSIPAATLLSSWLVPHLITWYRLRGRPVPEDAMTGVVPPSATADASNRAFRTFIQGLGLDVVGSVSLALIPALAGADFAWTRTYWILVGSLAAKTALQTAISYVARRAIPPPGSAGKPAGGQP
jgi:uncharacterized membrane protein YuzA (DUF378 family)